ncbi:MAG: DUF1800 domain-containing protein [Gammaproteobacteria bacterium]|nr:DUF1800 domain-containing protein [Gammaproteobacteria bacterium]
MLQVSTADKSLISNYGGGFFVNFISVQTLSNTLQTIKKNYLFPFFLLLVTACNPALAFQAEIFVNDALSNTPLADTKVTVLKQNTDGGFSWHSSQQTNIQGFTQFDLEPGTYHFKSRAYDQYAYSGVVQDAQNVVLHVGRLPVTLRHGHTGNPLGNAKITLLRQESDGKYRWAANGTTDAEGRYTFEPEFNSASGQALFKLKAYSPVDGSSRYSDTITQNGEFLFEIGGEPLNVELTNALDGEQLNDVRVTAYEKLADGSKQWVSQHNTDENGMAVFDLQGLGNGRSYFLKARPYDKYVYSDELTATGEIKIQAGILPVKLTNRLTGESLGNTHITLEQIGSDGNYHWVDSGKTGEEGLLTFEPAALTGSTPGLFRLRAASPIDGSARYSDTIDKIGAVTFSVGGAPLNATVVDVRTNTPLAGVRVTVYEKKTDGSSHWISQQISSDQGAVTFDLENLDGSHNYFLKARPFDQTVYSPIFNSPDTVTLRAGLLPVTLVSGLTGEALEERKVTLERKDDTGQYRWAASGKTNESGVHIFEPQDIGPDQPYRLRAYSPVDNSVRYSEELTLTGNQTFTLGGQVLSLTVINAIEGSPITDLKVYAIERLDDGSTQTRHRLYTDAAGLARFDLEGLGEGRKYFFKTTPFNGGAVLSGEVNEPGDLLMQLGSTPVTLIDSESGAALAGIKIQAVERLANGDLKQRKQGVSDDAGTVHFDLPGLGSGSTYVFRAVYPFGQGNKYYSPWRVSTGAFDFSIHRDGEFSHDRHNPEINLLQPVENSLVPHSGFTASAVAQDNIAVTRVMFSINDPALGAHEFEAQLNTESQRWEALLGNGVMSPNQDATLIATAYDRMGNTAQAIVVVQPIVDDQAPLLSVQQPSAGQDIPRNGFFARGTLTDNTNFVSMTASLSGLAYSRDIEISANGQWGFAIPKGTLGSTASQVQLRLHAVDQVGNVTEKIFDLNVVAPEAGNLHRLSRISFSPAPESLARLESIGWDDYLQEQLNPEAMTDPVLDSILADWSLDSRRDLQYYQLARATFSEKQLQEVMAWFWDNHFNTDLAKHGHKEFEFNESRAFRENAFGYFRDLLDISAKSPAMVIYLDSNASRKEEPSENYARELLELHTMGVDGGYAHHDIEELARVFTGWRIRNKELTLVDRYHDFDDKVLLGHTIQGAGLSEGDAVLDILAAHPSTASFICTKLATLFIADEPPSAVVAGCAEVFLNSNGLIAEVLTYLLSSEAFEQAGSFHAKVKTPLEISASLVRITNAYLAEYDMLNAINAMGMPLFYNPTPTGWSEKGEAWANSSQVLSRILLANRIAANRSRDNYTHIQPLDWARALGLETPQSIADYLLHLALGNDFTALEQTIAYDTINGNDLSAFDIDNEEAEVRLRMLMGTVLSFPGFSLQ